MQDLMTVYLMLSLMWPCMVAEWRARLVASWLMLKVTHLPPTKHHLYHQGPLWREGRGRQETTSRGKHIALPHYP